jgi:hypothetical protein
MLTVVAMISFLVQLYSLGYMAGDPGFGRYYGCMSLFAWAMLTLTVSSSLLQLYIFWELVGLASYLLIGFWFDKFSASEAGKKAFVMTRTGDVAFSAGSGVALAAAGDPGHSGADRPRKGGGAAVARHDHADRPVDLRRHRGQERPVSAAHLAARRHGGPHAGERPAAFGNHGGRRRLSVCTAVRFFLALADGHGGLPGHRHDQHAAGFHHGHGGPGHQTGLGLFHHQPIGLHAHGAGRRQPVCGCVSPDHPCRLQGAFVPYAPVCSSTTAAPTICSRSVGRAGAGSSRRWSARLWGRGRFPACRRYPVFSARR